VIRRSGKDFEKVLNVTPIMAAGPRVHTTVVTDRREPHPGIVVLGLRAPALAGAARPGQFAMAVPPSGLLAATALGIYEARGERASLMIVTAGPRTAELARLQVGDALDLLGPLGNGFDLESLPASVGIVAGGVGLASVLLAAERCVRAGSKTTLYYGARNGGALVDRELFAEIGCEVVVATDDGSEGHRGFVTDLLRKQLPELVLACGPARMLRAVAAIAQERGVATQLSLEETFACGVGACWGCVVPIDRASRQAPKFPPPSEREPRPYAHARVCREGPVFWAHELRW
jgi:dihydroorotate dehydrogenase electron transfer subunit